MNHSASFSTITGEDWRHSLTRARQHRAGTTNRIRTQLHTHMSTTPTVTDAHRALAEKINNSENYTSGGVPEADIAQWLAEHDAALTARLEAAEALVALKDDAFKKIENIRWGWDGDCGAKNIAEDALDLTPTHTASVIAELRERIDWLEQQREEECKQKNAALNESRICLRERDSLRQELGQAVEEKVNVVMKRDAEIARLTEIGIGQREINSGLSQENQQLERQRDALIEAGNNYGSTIDLLCNGSQPDWLLSQIKEGRINWDAAVSGASSSAVSDDTARLDDLLHAINFRGTLALTERYEFGINLPLDRPAIDAARKASA